jgi:hypothetical protein
MEIDEIIMRIGIALLCIALIILALVYTTSIPEIIGIKIAIWTLVASLILALISNEIIIK